MKKLSIIIILFLLSTAAIPIENETLYNQKVTLLKKMLGKWELIKDGCAFLPYENESYKIVEEIDTSHLSLSLKYYNKNDLVEFNVINGSIYHPIEYHIFGEKVNYTYRIDSFDYSKNRISFTKVYQENFSGIVPFRNIYSYIVYDLSNEKRIVQVCITDTIISNTNKKSVDVFTDTLIWNRIN